MTQIIWGGLALPDADSDAQTTWGVAVEGSRIVASGARDTLRAQHPGAQEHGGAGLLLLPAFVDAHDHGRALGTATLGLPDDLLECWLPRLWSQPPLDPYLAAAYDGLRLLRSGVTTVAHSHNPRDWRSLGAEAEATLRGYRDAGIRVAFHPPIVDQNALVYDDRARFLAGLPPSVAALAQGFIADAPLPQAAYFALCDDLFARHHDATEHLVHLQVSPAGGQWCSDALTSAAVAWARTHGTRVQMHMLETYYQRLYAERRWGASFPRHLDQIGALGPWLTLAHMVWADDDDLPLLAERGAGVAHNPSSNLRLRSGIAPTAAMMHAAVALGVGLDGHALDDDQDYLRELRLAWTLSNRPGAEAATVRARDILHIGTAGGAAVTLGAHVPLGKLAPGFLADLVLVNWEQVGYWGFGAVADTLLHRATREHVDAVMVGGCFVVRDGRSATLDEPTVAAQLRESSRAQDSTEWQRMAAAAQALVPYLKRFYAAWEDVG